MGCRADTATQERQPDTTIRVKAATAPSTAISVPQNPLDMGIRRSLNLAIARDTELRNRQISFIVANGDVSVTGTVRTEEERRKINDLAMNVGGVKSVANALLIAEAE
jgi:osmotically-inducible protein OsmY